MKSKMMGVFSLAFAILFTATIAIAGPQVQKVQGGLPGVGTAAPDKKAPAPAPAPAMAPPAPAPAPAVAAPAPAVGNTGNSSNHKKGEGWNAELGTTMRWDSLHRNSEEYDGGYNGKLLINVGRRLGDFRIGGDLQLGADPFRRLGSSRDFDLSHNLGYAQGMVEGRYYLTKKSYLLVAGGVAENFYAREMLYNLEGVAKVGTNVDINTWLSDKFMAEQLSTRQLNLSNETKFDLGPLYLAALGNYRFGYINHDVVPQYLEFGGAAGVATEFGLDLRLGGLYTPSTDSATVLFGATWTMPPED